MTQSTVESIEWMVRQGIHPKEVAKVVIDVINDLKPKLRYLVGKDAEETSKLVGNYLNKGSFRQYHKIS